MPFGPRSSNPRDSGDYEDYLERGLYQMQQGDLDGALTSFKKSMQLNRLPEDNPLAYLNLGLIHIEKKQFGAALKLLDAIIEVGIVPAIYTAHLYKGEALSAMKKWKDAERVLSDGIRYLEPGRTGGRSRDYEQPPELIAIMHYNRAIARFNQSKLGEAVEDYTSAIQYHGGDMDYYAGRCIAQLKSGNIAGAQKDYEFIQRHAPNHPVLRQVQPELRAKTRNQEKAARPDLGPSPKESAVGKSSGPDVGSGDRDTIANIVREANAKSIRLASPAPKYPDSPEKRQVVKQLVEERYYDAAALVLETMQFPDAAKWDRRVKQFILARSFQGQVLGVLEEWIVENPQLFGYRHELARDALTYLRDSVRERNREVAIAQAIVEQLMLNNGFSTTDISRVSLDGVNLAGVLASNSDFSMSSLRQVNFGRSFLQYSRFIGADLRDADLTGADCNSTDFQRADLRGANLSGADLTDADLVGANMLGARFSTTTKLPDGTFWAPGAKLERFTGLSPQLLAEHDNGLDDNSDDDFDDDDFDDDDFDDDDFDDDDFDDDDFDDDDFDDDFDDDDLEL